MEPSTPIYSQKDFAVRKNPHLIALWRAFGMPMLYPLAALSMIAFAFAVGWWGIYLFSLVVPPIDGPVDPAPLWLSITAMPFGGFMVGAIVEQLIKHYMRRLAEVEKELMP